MSLGSYECVCDVGAGDGTFLQFILEQHPKMLGMICADNELDETTCRLVPTL